MKVKNTYFVYYAGYLTDLFELENGTCFIHNVSMGTKVHKMKISVEEAAQLIKEASTKIPKPEKGSIDLYSAMQNIKYLLMPLLDDENKLTLDKLYSIPAKTIFKTGFFHDTRLYPSAIEFAAVKENDDKWCIRYSLPGIGVLETAQTGPLLKQHDIIRKIVPCSDEVFEYYMLIKK